MTSTINKVNPINPWQIILPESKPSEEPKSGLSKEFPDDIIRIIFHKIQYNIICYGRVALTTKSCSKMLGEDQALGVMKSLYQRALGNLPQVKENSISRSYPEGYIRLFNDLRHIDLDKTLSMLKEEIKETEDSLNEIAKNKQSIIFSYSGQHSPNATKIRYICYQLPLIMDLLKRFPYEKVNDLLEAIVKMGTAISQFNGIDELTAVLYIKIVDHLSFNKQFDEAKKFAELLKSKPSKTGSSSDYRTAHCLIVSRQIYCDRGEALEIIKNNPLFIKTSFTSNGDLVNLLPHLTQDLRASIREVFADHPDCPKDFLLTFDLSSSKLDLDWSCIENKKGGTQFYYYSALEQMFRKNDEVEKAEEISKRMLGVNFEVKDLSQWERQLEKFFSFFIEKGHEEKVEKILGLVSNGDVKINALLSCARAYQAKKNPEKAIHYLEQTRKLINTYEIDRTKYQPNLSPDIILSITELNKMFFFARIAKIYGLLKPEVSQELIRELEKRFLEKEKEFSILQLRSISDKVKLAIAELLMPFDPLCVKTLYPNTANYDFSLLSSFLKLSHPLQPFFHSNSDIHKISL